MIRTVFICCLTGLAAGAWAQSPWTRSKAGFYTQAAWHFIPAYESIFASDGGEMGLEREISEQTLQFYSEYGITRRTTVVAMLPVRFLKTGDLLTTGIPPQTTAGTLSGLGNSSISFRRKIRDRNLAVTASFRVDLPVDRYDDFTGLSLGYNAWTFMPSISIGRGYQTAYWFAYSGYGFRTNDFSDVFNLGAEGGLHVGPLWAILFTDWLQPMRNGSVVLPPRNNLTGLYVNNQGYVAVGFKVLLEINRFTGAFFSFSGATTAQLVPRSPGMGLGAYFKWE